MYPIGLFSKMNRITTKTLRHYEKIGLLMPEKVDEFSGYRYYSSNQLQLLNQITALKQMGMALADIKEIMENPKSSEIFLKTKEAEIVNNIKEEEKKLSYVRNYLCRLRGEFSMNYNPVIKTLPSCIVASMRYVADSYNSFFDYIPKMGKEMGRVGAVCAEPAYCFNIYHDGEYKEQKFDVEVCEAVVDYCENTDMITFKEIEEVKEAVCVLHKGAYEFLADAYNFLFDWIIDNGYEVVGLPRESYIDGIWNKDDEMEWLTEVQIPVSLKKK